MLNLLERWRINILLFLI
ncbi:hypothetical protein Gogos_000434 [Gossypium gossypioides]|uniref:Uncharacterized protein n=1 Tax=Gossypium gossypioides TaxID=34282 RepID=A0A7J9CST2_GOSGO|nr:hypothetical protein [Gossypium gossypioides]